MNAKGCFRNLMNRLALGFFIEALIFLGVFHFLPYDYVRPGWLIWRDLYRFLAGEYSLHWAIKSYIGASSFVMMSFLVVISPALIPIVSRTLSMRWLMCMMSLAGGLGLCLKVGQSNHFEILILAVFLHLLGCLCIRRPKPEEFVPAPHPDA